MRNMKKGRNLNLFSSILTGCIALQLWTCVVLALTPGPLCEQLTDEITADSITSAGNPIDMTQFQRSQIAAFENNMRVEGFQCCQDQFLRVTGLRAKFQTISGLRTDTVTNYIPDTVRAYDSPCIGPDCKMSIQCGDFVYLPRFGEENMATHLSEFNFQLHQELGFRQIIAKVTYQALNPLDEIQTFGQSIPLCSTSTSFPPQPENYLISVDFPIVAFEFVSNQDDGLLAAFRAVQNTCSIHPNTAQELTNSEKPIFIQLEDTINFDGVTPFFGNRELPVRPSWLIEYEFYPADVTSQLDQIDTTCQYSLANALTGVIPQYVSIADNESGIPTLTFTTSQVDLPSEPVHDFITIKCAIPNVFTVTTTVSVIIYSDKQAALTGPESCYLQANSGVVLPPIEDQVEPTEAMFRGTYRMINEKITIMCCRAVNSIVVAIAGFSGKNGEVQATELIDSILLNDSSLACHFDSVQENELASLTLTIFDKTESEESYSDLLYTTNGNLNQKSFCYSSPVGPEANPQEVVEFGPAFGRFAIWMYSVHSYLVNLRIYRDVCLGTPEYFPIQQFPQTINLQPETIFTIDPIQFDQWEIKGQKLQGIDYTLFQDPLSEISIIQGPINIENVYQFPYKYLGLTNPIQGLFSNLFTFIVDGPSIYGIFEQTQKDLIPYYVKENTFQIYFTEFVTGTYSEFRIQKPKYNVRFQWSFPSYDCGVQTLLPGFDGTPIDYYIDDNQSYLIDFSSVEIQIQAPYDKGTTTTKYRGQIISFPPPTFPSDPAYTGFQQTDLSDPQVQFYLPQDTYFSFARRRALMSFEVRADFVIQTFNVTDMPLDQYADLDLLMVQGSQIGCKLIRGATFNVQNRCDTILAESGSTTQMGTFDISAGDQTNFFTFDLPTLVQLYGLSEEENCGLIDKYTVPDQIIPTAFVWEIIDSGTKIKFTVFPPPFNYLPLIGQTFNFMMGVNLPNNVIPTLILQYTLNVNWEDIQCIPDVLPLSSLVSSQQYFFFDVVSEKQDLHKEQFDFAPVSCTPQLRPFELDQTFFEARLIYQNSGESNFQIIPIDVLFDSNLGYQTIHFNVHLISAGEGDIIDLKQIDKVFDQVTNTYLEFETDRGFFEIASICNHLTFNNLASIPFNERKDEFLRPQDPLSYSVIAYIGNAASQLFPVPAMYDDKQVLAVDLNCGYGISVAYKSSSRGVLSNSQITSIQPASFLTLQGFPSQTQIRIFSQNAQCMQGNHSYELSYTYNLPSNTKTYPIDIQVIIQPECSLKTQILQTSQSPYPSLVYFEDDIKLPMDPFEVQCALTSFIFDEKTTLSLFDQEDNLLAKSKSELQNQEMFLIEDPRLVNTTLSLNQQTQLWDACYHTTFSEITDLYQGEKIQHISEQVAEIEIKSRCPDFEIIEFTIPPIHVVAGSQKSNIQAIQKPQDQYQLIQREKCGNVTYELAEIDLPDIIFRLEGLNLILDGRNATGFEGNYVGIFRVIVGEYGIKYETIVQIAIQFPRPVDESEQRAAANSAPTFKGYAYSERNDLPPFYAIIGRKQSYQIPEPFDPDGDAVRIQIGLSNQILLNCNCIELDGERRVISVTLPLEYKTSVSTIFIYLNDPYVQANFFLYLVGRIPSPDDDLDVEEEKTLEKVGQFYANILKGDDLDLEEKEEKWSTLLDEGFCVPGQSSVTREGTVTLTFQRPLQTPDNGYKELERQIVDSGSIQLQLIDENTKQFEKVQQKSISNWSITFPNKFQIKIAIQFEQPESISNGGNSRDKLSIMFVSVDEFLKCESVLDLVNSENNRFLQSNLQQNTIPPNYQFIVELPPQDPQNKDTSVKNIIEQVEDPSKTIFFTSIIFGATFNISLQVLWGSVNSLQMISHLPLNNINFPSNAIYLFQFLASVVSFDILEPADYINFGFTETPPLNDRYEELGYQSTNFVENLGSIGLFIFLIFLRHLVQPPIQYVLSRCGCCRCWRNFQNFFALTGAKVSQTWIRFWLEAYFEILIACMVGLGLHQHLPQNGSEVPLADSITLSLTYLFIVLSILFLIMVSYVTLYQVRAKVQQEKERCEIKNDEILRDLYEDQRYHSNVAYGPSAFFYKDERLKKKRQKKEKKLARKLRKQKTQNQKQTLQKQESGEDKSEKTSKRTLMTTETLQSQESLVSLPDIKQQRKFKKAKSEFYTEDAQMIVQESEDKSSQYTRQNSKTPLSLRTQSTKNRIAGSYAFEELMNKRRIAIKERPKDLKPEKKISNAWFPYFSTLFTDLKMYHIRAMWNNFIHVVRRWVFVYFALYQGNLPIVQTIVFVAGSLLRSLYLMEQKPYEDTQTGALETFYEIIVLITGYHMIVLTGFEMTSSVRLFVGFSLNFFVLCLIVVSVVFFVKDFYGNCLFWCKLQIYRVKQRRLVAKRKKLYHVKATAEDERYIPQLKPLSLQQNKVGVEYQDSIININTERGGLNNLSTERVLLSDRQSSLGGGLAVGVRGSKLLGIQSPSLFREQQASHHSLIEGAARSESDKNEIQSLRDMLDSVKNYNQNRYHYQKQHNQNKINDQQEGINADDPEQQGGGLKIIALNATIIEEESKVQSPARDRFAFRNVFGRGVAESDGEKELKEFLDIQIDQAAQTKSEIDASLPSLESGQEQRGQQDLIRVATRPYTKLSRLVVSNQSDPILNNAQPFVVPKMKKTISRRQKNLGINPDDDHPNQDFRLNLNEVSGIQLQNVLAENGTQNYHSEKDRDTLTNYTTRQLQNQPLQSHIDTENLQFILKTSEQQNIILNSSRNVTAHRNHNNHVSTQLSGRVQRPQTTSPDEFFYSHNLKQQISRI